MVTHRVIDKTTPVFCQFFIVFGILKSELFVSNYIIIEGWYFSRFFAEIVKNRFFEGHK